MPDDPLDRLEQHAEDLVSQYTYEQENRRGLLWIHAAIGMSAGIQMFLYGSATTIENSIGVWTRVVMAGLGIAGGVMLALGLSRRPRSIPMEVSGLCLVGIWDGLMTAGLLYARLHQHDFHIIPLGTPLDQGYVVAYPVTVYFGLFALICVHLYTLRKIRRNRK